MKTVGLVTEYNPFHNGHKYHLDNSLESTHSDSSIAVMSGNFLQRGEPALINKWTRAQIAVDCGVNLVLELPLIYSISSAENFAYGSISILDKIGVVDSVCFGSESGKIDDIVNVARILYKESDKFKLLLKEELSKGLTFPKAREHALMRFSNDKIEFKSNNILGIEYVKAMLTLKSKIKPTTIKRVANDYHSTQITGSISSATAIRELIRRGVDVKQNLSQIVPPTTNDILVKEINDGSCVFLSDLSEILLYKLRTSDKGFLREIHEVNEGIENLLVSASEKSKSIEELIEIVKSKRYTHTRIKRILLNVIFNITKEMHQESKELHNPGFIRVLGFDKKGAEILRRIKKEYEFPIITNPNKFDFRTEYDKKLFKIDTMATNVYSLISKSTESGWDFTRKPYMKR